MSGTLPDFEGLAVVGVRIEVRNIAGGLNDAIDVNPVVLHQGDEVDLRVRCKLRSIRHDPADKDVPDGPQYRVQILSASRVLIEDPSDGDEKFAAQAELLAQRDEIKGQAKLPTSPPFLGYDDLSAAEVAERLDDADLDFVDRVESYEEANGGRGEVLKACASARKVLEKHA